MHFCSKMFQKGRTQHPASLRASACIRTCHLRAATTTTAIADGDHDHDNKLISITSSAHSDDDDVVVVVAVVLPFGSRRLDHENDSGDDDNDNDCDDDDNDCDDCDGHDGDCDDCDNCDGHDSNDVSSRTDLCDNVVDVTSSSALDVVEKRHATNIWECPKKGTMGEY